MSHNRTHTPLSTWTRLTRETRAMQLRHDAADAARRVKRTLRA